ncbi:hypothetical protein [Fictibacillus barbaricus]|uniref:Flagellar hook-length control protein-like C-terminal domain-containing protein n=1 Tax=Fictibacillus barbaricus TaxID=182136 RepID=A0ABU1U576_9BACL|nr:hypothetical protein [Fictibacillus barbaricus]MDR7074548.1 hypothetical protein [Fictibacillus barbaricus]
MLTVNSVNPLLPASKVSEAFVALKPNQLLMAKILEIFPDQSAKILYDGITIQAKLDAPLSKGERYLFEVMPHSNNQTVILKKVDADLTQSAPEQILNKLNIPVQKNEIKAAEFAIAEKAPLTKENIKLIAAILQHASSLPYKEKQQVIHQMLRLQLPASQLNVKAIIASIIHKNVHLDMKPLFDSLQAFTHKSAYVEKTINLLGDLFGYSRKAEESNDQLPTRHINKVMTNAEQKLPDKPVADVLYHLNTSPSKTEKSVRLDQPRTVVPEPLTISAGQEKAERFSASEMFLQAAEKWLKNSGLLHERTLLNNPEQVKQTETLKSQLLLLHQNAEQLELPETVKQKIDQAIYRITSQQIQNISSNDGMQQFILQIPFHSEIQPKEITIRWEGKKGKGDRLDPEHCRMLFWLEMQHLKEVAVDVHIQNRILSIKVYSGYPALENLTAALTPRLKKSLNEMEYTLSSLTFLQKEKNEIKFSETASFYKGMDLRV